MLSTGEYMTVSAWLLNAARRIQQGTRTAGVSVTCRKKLRSAARDALLEEREANLYAHVRRRRYNECERQSARERGDAGSQLLRAVPFSGSNMFLALNTVMQTTTESILVCRAVAYSWFCRPMSEDAVQVK